MPITSGVFGIIADDLTGANDTALQFHLRGCNTQILFDYSTAPKGLINTQAWAISTETRNLAPDSAAKLVNNAAKMMIQNLNIEYLYKKIDSTLRGNIASEALAALNAIGWDATVIVPAFPAEGRTTVGGYQLLKGMPIERTEFARDIHSPIFESHIPTLLKQQVEDPEIVAHVELQTVMKGAGPILMKLQELIKQNKKLIVADAVTTTDLEQIVLAIEKSNYKIMPCGSAGLAQCLAKFWLPEMKHQHISKVIPELPIFIVSGSATNATKTQIQKLYDTDEYEPYFIELKPNYIFAEPSEEMVERIVKHLGTDGIVVVYSAPLDRDLAETLEYANQQGIQQEDVPGIVSDYLAKLTQKVIDRHNLILVTIGGETSYKCCNAIDSRHLQLIDEVEHAIPLCLDHKAQWIVTKSGNLGATNTLVNIIKYFKKHQETK